MKTKIQLEKMEMELKAMKKEIMKRLKAGEKVDQTIFSAKVKEFNAEVKKMQSTPEAIAQENIRLEHNRKARAHNKAVRKNLIDNYIEPAMKSGELTKVTDSVSIKFVGFNDEVVS